MASKVCTLGFAVAVLVMLCAEPIVAADEPFLVVHKKIENVKRVKDGEEISVSIGIYNAGINHHYKMPVPFLIAEQAVWRCRQHADLAPTVLFLCLACRYGLITLITWKMDSSPSNPPQVLHICTNLHFICLLYLTITVVLLTSIGRCKPMITMN
jgi:hypothetical protein